jgi:hypothetical protein
MSKHTQFNLKVEKELGSRGWQWLIAVDAKDKGRGIGVAETLPGSGQPGQELENARRLVACWNACSGISTENLEDNIPILELANRYNDSIKQRNELLEALRGVVSQEAAGKDVS